MRRCVIVSILLTSLCRCQISVSRHLRQSPLELQGHDISLDSDTTNLHKRRADIEGKKQRVVLIAGPHKTSSSSEQHNIFRWVNDDERFLPGWSWPAPTIDGRGFCTPKSVISMDERPKVFYTYIGVLNGHGKKKCLMKWYAHEGMTKKNLINDFEQEFRNSWGNGNNLIIASEAMDFVSSTDKEPNNLLDRILKGMPWNSYDDSATRLEGSNDDITVVVNFRAPRVDHLLSLWHQCCMKTMTFQEYLTIHVRSGIDVLHSLDSLRLAKVFLEKNLQVTLLDMSGILSRGYDTSNIVACDVLNADCTSNKTVVGDPIYPSMNNVKQHSHGGTDAQLEEMENIIRNYDCNFQDIVHNKKLKILYAQELDKIFSNCANISPDERITSIEVMSERLSKVAQNFDHAGLDGTRD